MNIRAVLVIPDLQVPYEDPVALNAVEQYMAAHRWDQVIYIGDFLDFDCISSHNKNNLRAVEGKRILLDYEMGNDILDRHEELVYKRNKNALFTLIEGNHEHRMERYLDANPQMSGMIEVEVGLRLKERGVKWVRNWSEGEIYRVGKASFVHGQYTNSYHAKKMVDSYGCSIFYGHTHDMMCIPRPHRGRKDLHVGQSLGSLCNNDLSYMRGRPSQWQQGFGVFFFLPNGNFTYYTPRIVDGSFIGPDGVLYTGKKPKKKKDALWRSLKR